MKPRQDGHRSWTRKCIVPSAAQVSLGQGPEYLAVLQDLSPAGAGMRLYAAGLELPEKYTRGSLKIGGRQYTFSVAWAAADAALGSEAGSLRLGVRFDQPNVEVFQRKDLTDAAIASRAVFFEAAAEGPMLHVAMYRLSALATAADAAAELLLILSWAGSPERFAVFEPRLGSLESEPRLRGSLQVAADVAAVLEPAEALRADRGASPEPPLVPGPFELADDELADFSRRLAEGLGGWAIATDVFAVDTEARRVLEERLLPALDRLHRGETGFAISFAPAP